MISVHADTTSMPTLQQLAREGTTFDHAYTPSPMCAPSRAIIQSGLYSQNNGVTQNDYRQFVQSGAITLETLRKELTSLG